MQHQTQPGDPGDECKRTEKLRGVSEPADPGFALRATPSGFLSPGELDIVVARTSLNRMRLNFSRKMRIGPSGRLEGERRVNAREVWSFLGRRTKLEWLLAYVTCVQHMRLS